MIFEKIVKRISEEYSIDILCQEKDSEVQDVALIDAKHDRTLKNTLYFGYDKQIKNALCPSQCILARTGAAAVPEAQGGNVAIVAEEALFPIFNTVKNLIEVTRSEGVFEELTALADETMSIDAVIDAASVRLGSFLVFCDMNFKIIANSVSIPVLDPLWKENTGKGYCDYEFINAVRELNSIRNASQTTSAVEVTCTQSPYRKLSSKVFHNKTQIGFLLMIEGEKHILPSHYEMLSTISHVISYTVAYYTPDLFDENSSLYHELLYDMLIGAPPKDITPRLAGLTFPPKMLVLFLRPTKYLGQQYMKNNACKNLKAKIPGAHVVYHKNGMAAVIPCEEDADSSKNLPEILGNFTKKNCVRIGVSNSFKNIEGFVGHFDQAYAALELGQKLKSEETVCFYENYQVFDLLSEIKNPEKLGRYCHPALALLRQYDHANNSQLYKTLCVYIENKCNIKQTSENLFIHRNSLVYRLDRITEICGLDLSDIDTLFLLRLSFLIDRYNELNTSIEWGKKRGTAK